MLQTDHTNRREKLVGQFGGRDLDSWLWLEMSVVLPWPEVRNTKGASGSCSLLSGFCSFFSFYTTECHSPEAVVDDVTKGERPLTSVSGPTTLTTLAPSASFQFLS